MPFTVSPMFPGDLYDTMDQMAVEEMLAWSRNESGIGSAKWQQILELGWQGVLIKEACGGVGATLVEFASIAEAAGRHATIMPLIARCVVAPMLLARCESAAIADLLDQVSAGRASVCPVMESARTQTLMAKQLSDGRFQLHGVLRSVDLTEPASHFIFNALADEGDLELLILLPSTTLEMNKRSFAGLDGRRTVDIEIRDVTVESKQVLLKGPSVGEALADAIATGAVLTCVQTVGALGAMIEQTIEYLSTRKQFGVALSTFQALRHKVVEMYVAYESARGLVKRDTEEMSQSAATGTSNARDVALTKLYLTTIGRTVAESAIQLHGGMGMTVEMPAARLAMHTLMCGLQYGDRLHYLDQLSAQMKDAAPATPMPV